MGRTATAGRTAGRTAIKVAAVAVTAGATAAAAVAAVKTARMAPESLPTQRNGRRATIRGITINRPPAEVYTMWRDLPRLAAAMERAATATPIDERRSRWKVRGPLGTTIEYTAEIVEDIPDKLLVWRVADGPVPHEGRASFTEAPGDRGTEVLVTLKYHLPGGPVGAAAATLTGDEPDQVLRGSLRRIKQLLECGEVIATDEQPSGRSPMQERVTHMVQHKLATGGRP